ncbi:hypothetical protein [Streptomyces subrutilus]
MRSTGGQIDPSGTVWPAGNRELAAPAGPLRGPPARPAAPVRTR